MSYGTAKTAGELKRAQAADLAIFRAALMAIKAGLPASQASRIAVEALSTVEAEKARHG